MTLFAPAKATSVRDLKPTDPRLVSIGVGAAVVFALVTSIALQALGRPASLDRKLQLIDARLRPLEARAQNAPEAFAYPKDAVCKGSADLAARRLQGAIATVSLRFKLAAASASVGVAPGEGDLRPLDVSLDGNGDYLSAIAALRGLTAMRPLLLVDRLDLTPEQTYVHLHLSGRAYCWSPAHL